MAATGYCFLRVTFHRRAAPEVVATNCDKNIGSCQLLWQEMSAIPTRRPSTPFVFITASVSFSDNPHTLSRKDTIPSPTTRTWKVHYPAKNPTCGLP